MRTCLLLKLTCVTRFVKADSNKSAKLPMAQWNPPLNREEHRAEAAFLDAKRVSPWCGLAILSMTIVIFMLIDDGAKGKIICYGL